MKTANRPRWRSAGTLAAVAAMLGIALVSPAVAQGPPDLANEERAAMSRLQFLVGEWEGDATIQSGPNRRTQLLQTESVRWMLDGVILLIEGTGYQRGEDGTVGDVVFNALGIVSYDAERGYTMRSWVRTGQEGARELTVADSGFVWYQEVPGGRMRYTMRLTPDGAWHEMGEFSRDGDQWFRSLEMLLHRKGEE